MRFFKFAIIFLMFCFVWSFSAWAGELKQVLILPFNVYSQKNFSYLKDAIPQMLTSRLFTPSKIEVIDPDKVTSELKGESKIDSVIAKNLGFKFKADYVIWGNVTVLENSVSINAEVVDLSGEKKPEHFSQEIKSVSEIIPQISHFAQKIKMYIEGNEKVLSIGNPFVMKSSYIPERAHPERICLPYYYYQQKENKGFLSRLWSRIWPFGKEKKSKNSKTQVIQTPQHVNSENPGNFTNK